MRSSVLAGGARVVVPLDRARGVLLRAGGGVARRLVRERAARVAVGGSFAVLVALVLASVAPIWLLLLGPVLLGVPHLAADIRYAVLRIGLHRARAGLLALPLLIAAVWQASPPLGLLAAAVAAAATRGHLGRRVLVVLSLLVAAGHMATLPMGGLVVFAHGHNLIAIVLWMLWWRDRSWLRVLPLAAFALAAGAILLGFADATAGSAGGVGGVELSTFVTTLAPGVSEPWGLRLVVLFAMAQSVHYAIWLRLVPDDDRERSTTRTFASSWRAFVGDVTPVGAMLTVALSAAVVGWAVFDLVAARDGYLRLASFHGYIELIALSVLLVRPLRAPGEVQSGPPLE